MAGVPGWHGEAEVNGERVQARDAGNAGLEWVIRSLRDGSPLSQVLSSHVVGGPVVALVPPEFTLTDTTEFTTGGVVGGDAAASALGRLISELEPSTHRLLVVDDDLSRVGDPGLSDDSDLLLLAQERVARWIPLTPGGTQTVDPFIRESSSGYPSNAFVVSGTASELISAHVDGSDLVAHWLGRRLEAIVVAAFDAETWLIWSASSGASEPG